MRWRRAAYAAAILLASAAAFPVSGEPSPPAAPPASPSDPVVVIDTGQHTYRIPYEYLSIRPPLGAVEPVNHWRRFSFAFWMPDGRPSQEAGHELGTLRPPEPGAPPPGPNSYIVIATNVTAWDGPDAVPRPGMELENYLGGGGGSDRYEYQSRFGMLEVMPKPGFDAPFDHFFGVRNFPELPIETSVLASCPRHDEWAVDHLCTGMVALQRLKVMFHIRLPAERMDQLMDAIGVAARLLVKWSNVDLHGK